MDVADGKEGAIPPPNLRLAWLCGPYHLPDGASLMEQDAATMAEMRELNNVFKTVVKFRSLTGDAVNTNLTISERLLLDQLRKMNLLGGLSG